MRILNLYAGIGGNRKLWGDEHEITAVELNPEIAKIYSDFFPNDEMIIGDAHDYLEKHYKEYDFIWSSPPCQSHSKIRMMASKAGSYDAIMPDMNLWREIIFLNCFSIHEYVVENVKPYYNPLIVPTVKLDRHLFWANFEIPKIEIKDGLKHNERGMNNKGFFDLSNYKLNHRKDQIIRNSVNPEIGLYILNQVLRKTETVNEGLFAL